MARKKSEGAVITATITGNTSGMIAVGVENRQRQVIHNGDQDLQVWMALVADLK